MAHYDDAQHAGDTGAALADLVLAALDNPDRAAELPRLPDAAIEDACRRLEDAVDLRRPELARCRALSEIGLAKLMMATGDLDDAIAGGAGAGDRRVDAVDAWPMSWFGSTGSPSGMGITPECRSCAGFCPSPRRPERRPTRDWDPGIDRAVSAPNLPLPHPGRPRSTSAA